MKKLLLMATMLLTFGFVVAQTKIRQGDGTYSSNTVLYTIDGVKVRQGDGTYGQDGLKVQDGIYTYKIVYKLKTTAKHELITGHINLIR